MATFYSNRPIVTDGLVFCLDAGNPKSYPGSGTTWYDLSGNDITGTLTNSPTFNSSNLGSIVFDGTNYVICAGSITTTQATFISWIKTSTNQADGEGILFSRGTSVTGMNFRPATNNQLTYHWNNASNTYLWNSGLFVPNNLSWCMIAVSVTSTSAIAYLCQSTGITTATNNVSHSSTTIDDINLARDEALASRYFNGYIAQSLIYNRALSAQEISQNFNALRGRYGI